MLFGDEYFTSIITEDDYLYNPNELKREYDYKIKSVLFLKDYNPEGGTALITVVFEDGYYKEFTLD